MLERPEFTDYLNKFKENEKGKTIWLYKEAEVTNFPLTDTQRKTLKRLNGEADRKERWKDVPIDVIVSKDKKGVIEIYLKVREDGV